MTNQDDRAAIGQVIKALYPAISGPAGPRDWDAHQGAFHEAGRQMRAGVNADGTPWIKVMDPAAYRTDAQPEFERMAFHEQEIARRIDIVGNMAQAWSLYGARVDPDSPRPERCGINSIQLFKDATGRWKIVSMRRGPEGHHASAGVRAVEARPLRGPKGLLRIDLGGGRGPGADVAPPGTPETGRRGAALERGHRCRDSLSLLPSRAG